MKKSLIALAALAATGVFAQSSVTIYGLVDAGYGSHTTKNTSGSISLKTTGVMDGSHAGSRIGFRGTEDLGGGLAANFVLEQGISPTSGDGFNKRVGNAAHQIDGAAYTAQNNRQAFLGLSSKGMGAVRVGFQYTNSYDLVAFNGLSASEFQGGNFQNGTTLVSGTTLSNHANGSRANAITYISPAIGNITVKAQYGQGAGRQTAESRLAATAAAAGATLETATGETGSNGWLKNNLTYTSLMAQYAAGPIYAAMAYSKADILTVPGTSPAVDPYGSLLNAQGQLAVTNATKRPVTAMTYGGSYDFGMAKITYTGAKQEGATSTSTAESVVKANQYTLFVPVGAAQFFVSTGNAKRTTGATVNNNVSGSAIGVRYNLSKRTLAYAFNGSEKDKAVTTASANAANYKDSKTVVGIAHSF